MESNYGNDNGIGAAEGGGGGSPGGAAEGAAEEARGASLFPFPCPGQPPGFGCVSGSGPEEDSVSLWSELGGPGFAAMECGEAPGRASGAARGAAEGAGG